MWPGRVGSSYKLAYINNGYEFEQKHEQSGCNDYNIAQHNNKIFS